MNRPSFSILHVRSDAKWACIAKSPIEERTSKDIPNLNEIGLRDLLSLSHLFSTSFLTLLTICWTLQPFLPFLQGRESYEDRSIDSRVRLQHMKPTRKGISIDRWILYTISVHVAIDEWKWRRNLSISHNWQWSCGKGRTPMELSCRLRERDHCCCRKRKRIER